ncbi:MAG: ABC transporter permease, partial [Oscillospiraceae bacterium]|nr:ABC transporter permease [Oscillospiraceae bacterium]
MDRLNSMVKVDARRMFTSSPFYVLCGVALAMPILILVMTSMAGGDAMAFTNTWRIIGSEGGMDRMNMDMTAMCNINLMFFMAGLFVCAFVAEDFKSGYVKNLFTVRAKKGDYVASKTIVCFIACALFLIAFFVGAVLGGAIAGLSFELGAAGIQGLVMCMLAKIFLMAVFVAIAVL